MNQIGELGALLVKRNVFTYEELQSLASLGVDNPDALLAVARDPEWQLQVAQQLDISTDSLLTAGFLARLLAVQGPGSVLARRMATEESDLSSWVDPENREDIPFILDLDPPNFLEFIADVAENSVQERSRRAQHVGNRNERWLWLALLILAPGAVFMLSWDDFFMPTRGEEILVAVRGFKRAGVLIDVGMTVALAFGTMVFAALLGQLSRRLAPTEYIYNRYLSWRDRLIASEAFALIPPRRAKIVEWFVNNLTIPLVVVTVIFVAATISLDLSTSLNWAAYVLLLGVAAVVLLLFILQAQAFSRLAQKSSWASPTRERYAEAQVLRLPLVLGVSALLLYFVFAPMYGRGLEALSEWNEDQQVQRTAEFAHSLEQLQVAPDQQAQWATVHADWIVWSQQRLAAGLAIWQRNVDEFVPAIKIFQWTIAVGMLGLLLAVALAEYLYASRSKGALGLAIWAAALVGSAYLPARLAQSLGISEATVAGAILTLAAATFIGVIGELGMTLRRRRTVRVCPKPECFAEVPETARYCPNCGTMVCGNDADTR